MRIAVDGTVRQIFATGVYDPRPKKSSRPTATYPFGIFHCHVNWPRGQFEYKQNHT